MRDLSGQQIGAYRLTRLIGEGGMGVVYEATHATLGHRVAIKFLHERLSRDQETVHRFENEARAAAIISSPGIVTVYEFLRQEDGQVCLIMEYLEGESLGTRLARLEKLPIATALRYIRQAASTLSAAHKKGITHRDLKPDNMFLLIDPEVEGGERVKLLDFGIAKIASDATGGGQSAPVKTRTGTMMGTPLYMSPEQCRGVRELDGKADVYSLGAVIFQLLTGVPPFVSEGAGQLMAMHLRAAPPTLQSRIPSVDARLSKLVASMLEKSAASRPSIDEVIEQLVALGAAPAAAIGVDAVRPPASRRGRELVAGSLVGGVALLVVAGLLVERRQLTQSLRAAQTAAAATVQMPLLPRLPKNPPMEAIDNVASRAVVAPAAAVAVPSAPAAVSLPEPSGKSTNAAEPRASNDRPTRKRSPRGARVETPAVPTPPGNKNVEIPLLQ